MKDEDDIRTVMDPLVGAGFLEFSYELQNYNFTHFCLVESIHRMLPRAAKEVHDLFLFPLDLTSAYCVSLFVFG